MTTLIPELLLGNATTYRNLVESRSGQDVTAEDAQGLVCEAVRVGKAAQDLWLSSMEELGRGTPAWRSRKLVPVLLDALGAAEMVVRLGIGIAEKAHRVWPEPGLDPKDERNLAVLLANLQKLSEEGKGVLELLDRPPQPFDPA